MKVIINLLAALKRILSDKWVSKKKLENEAYPDQPKPGFVEKSGNKNKNVQDTAISERSEEKEEIKEPDKVPSRQVNIQRDYVFLGIDFGTSKTAIAAYKGKNNKESGTGQLPISLRIGEAGVTNYMPSTVSFYPSGGNDMGSFETGEKAERIETGLRIHSIKRCLVCDGTLCEKFGRAPYPWCKKDGKVHINKKIYSSEYIASLIIAEALKRAESVLKTTSLLVNNKGVVININKMGCSTKFGLAYREILVGIIKDLGYKNIKISDVIEEPVLAGLANIRYLKEQQGRFLIYDFGGGTFDSAIIEVDRFENQPRITILSTAGDDWLGGDDIDNLISEFFIIKYAENNGKNADDIFDQLNNIDKNHLRYRAKVAKEYLTSETEFSDTLFSTAGMIPLELTRDELNNVLEENCIFNRSMDVTMKACKYSYAFDVLIKNDTLDVGEISRLEASQVATGITGVLSVGGISKIPLIRGYLYKYFGEQRVLNNTPIDPITSVSIGASINDYGSNFSVNCLPYGFKIYGEDDQNCKETINILEPYTYLDFFGYILSYGWFCFEKIFFLNNDLRYIEFFEFFPNGDKKEIELNLGKMQAGEWRILINIKGCVYFRGPDRKMIEIGYLKDLHPIQKKIVSNEKKRMNSRRKDIPVTLSWYED